MKRTPLSRRTPLRATAALARKTGLRAVTPLKAKSAPRKPRRDTGFSPATKLLIRARAGNGNPEEALCEACGIHLGRQGGQIQHIYARQAGGTKVWLYQSAANAALLCGTRYTGCHGVCENRAHPDNRHMQEMGFWRKRNGTEKPGDYPVMLHGKGGCGVQVYLTPAGTYSLRAPEEAA